MSAPEPNSCQAPLTPRTAINNCPRSPTIFDIPRIPAQSYNNSFLNIPTKFSVCPGGPLDRLRGQLPSLEDLSNVAHFVVYHVLSDMVTRPMAVLRGEISELFDEIVPYPLRRSNGHLTIFPFSSTSTAVLASDFCSVLNSEVAGSRLLRVQPQAGAKVYVFGERSRGFSFEAPSELDLNCTLFVTTWNEKSKLYENPVDDMINTIIIPDGELYLYLCDNRDVVAIYDENSKYFFVLNDSAQQDAKNRTAPRTPPVQPNRQRSKSKIESTPDTHRSPQTLRFQNFNVPTGSQSNAIGAKLQVDIGPDGIYLFDRLPLPEPEFWSLRDYCAKQPLKEQVYQQPVKIYSPRRRSMSDESDQVQPDIQKLTLVVDNPSLSTSLKNLSLRCKEASCDGGKCDCSMHNEHLSLQSQQQQKPQQSPAVRSRGQSGAKNKRKSGYKVIRPKSLIKTKASHEPVHGKCYPVVMPDCKTDLFRNPKLFASNPGTEAQLIRPTGQNYSSNCGSSYGSSYQPEKSKSVSKSAPKFRQQKSRRRNMDDPRERLKIVTKSVCKELIAQAMQFKTFASELTESTNSQDLLDCERKKLQDQTQCCTRLLEDIMGSMSATLRDELREKVDSLKRIDNSIMIDPNSMAIADRLIDTVKKVEELL